jgi:hypothetical protein
MGSGSPESKVENIHGLAGSVQEYVDSLMDDY